MSIYFANPNIHPKNEYLRRARVQEQFVHDFNERTGNNVRYIEAPYEPHEFMKMAKSRGLTEEPEGGARCSACFGMRLEMVAEAAVELGYDYFGSAITLSPKKNAQLINEIGLDVQQLYDVKYLPSDFKKIKAMNVQLRCVKIMTFSVNVTVAVCLLLNNKVLISKPLTNKQSYF